MTGDPAPARAARIDRRGLLVLGAGAAATFGGAALWRRLRPLEFTPIDGAPGFRRLGGPVRITQGQVLTAGLGGTGPDLPAAMRTARAAVAADLPAALGPGPAHFFTAAGCPLCAPQAERLAGLGLPVTLRPLALFGPTSERAARAMIAAGPDGWRLHDRLVGSAFRTEDAFIRVVAEDVVPDPNALMARMDAPETDAALALNHALSARLDLIGTPATLIGRVLVVGLTEAPILARLARQEGVGA